MSSPSPAISSQPFQAERINTQGIHKGPKSGTQLYLRTRPPANDAKFYGDDEYKAGPDCQFLGYAVIVMGVPRWMSSGFAEAADEDEKSDFLSNYSEDWIEKILYVAGLPEDIPEDVAKGPVVKKANMLIQANRYAQHFLSYGCMLCTGCTSIEEVCLSDGSLDGQGSSDAGKNKDGVDQPQQYYAVVSKTDADEPANAREITLARLADRKYFVHSAMHKAAKEYSDQLRQSHPNFKEIKANRKRAFNAIVKPRFDT